VGFGRIADTSGMPVCKTSGTDFWVDGAANLSADALT
jgi:hypothetical protein